MPHSPPPAPLLPPSPRKNKSRESPFALKVGSAPKDWFYQPAKPPALVDLFEPPIGPYFVYGTLMDPGMLADVLGLEHQPELRPAKIEGYSCKLWGQYPAMQDGSRGVQVSGKVYRVESVAHAKRLAEYETNSYEAKPCLIQYTDGKHPVQDYGHVFMFVGNTHDIQDGEFNLETWLKRMGRQPTT
ncbi:hypothetical protein FLONG3_7035 [Fusarium longipes]|uniref:Putative gamma-glutamylcyclotransferase n=1 Tax=Fusarium longipes TaxID=694270 RepID=A0A395SH92_9HYPO|nr:hypothetical protein FLONG3_7035 [Fusarium longipes]